MRAGPLSDEKIIARLNKDFVNSWILRKDLMQLAGKETDLGKFAAEVLERYSYPVDNLVLSGAGEFRGHLPANDAGALSSVSFHRLLDKVGTRENGRHASSKHE